MGIPFFGNKTSEFDSATMISITEGGKAALNSEVVKNINQYAILSSLDQHSPRSLSDLSKEAQQNINQTKREIMTLKRQKMVATVGD
jgi:hypothetical protein